MDKQKSVLRYIAISLNLSHSARQFRDYSVSWTRLNGMVCEPTYGLFDLVLGTRRDACVVLGCGCWRGQSDCFGELTRNTVKK